MRFGQFRLQEIIKQRGPVVTRRAQKDEGPQVILKMLQKEAVSPENVAVLQREYALIQEISSPQVVKALDLVWEEDCPALVLEDMGGQVLANLLTGAALPMTDALRVAAGAAEALEAVHSAGIMHGDINPYNLLVGETPDAIALIDFGFSERGGLPPREGAGLRGSPNYIAPELTGRLSQGADHRADLYSLGVLLYQMLTGSLPFQSGDLLQMVYAHMALQPRPLRDLAPSVPDVVEAVVTRLMSKRPEDRYQTAAGLSADLAQCLALVEGTLDESGFELGRKDIPRRLTLSKRVQGRQQEAERLRDAFDKVRRGAPSGLSVTIEGAAGVGKSTLVNALLSYVDRNGGLFVTGRVDAGAWDDPLGGIVEAAQRLTQLLLTDRYGSAEYWAARLKDGLGHLLPVLAAWVPELSLLCGDIAPPPQLEPREAAERLGQAFRRFFRLCGTPQHPLVLVLEDVHAADMATLALLDGLVRTSGPESLLLILTRRPTPDRADTPVTAPGTDDYIVLEPLGAKAVAEMLAETFRKPVEACAPLADVIVSKVAGVPLAVGQFLGALVDEGAVKFDPSVTSWTWDIDAVRARDTSDDVVDILLSRTARLTPEERATIGAAACAGRDFSIAEAETASGLTSDQVAAHLERAVSMGWIAPIITLSDTAQSAELRFLHDRVLDAAETLLDPADRMAAHGRLAAMHLAAEDGPPEGERLFSVARHLGMAVPVDAPAEARAQARGLNAAAGAAAMAVGDIRRSHFHFDISASLVGPEDWATNLPEALQIMGGAAGAALLAADIPAMMRWRAAFMENCPDPVARARFRTLDLFANLGQNKAAEAVEIGVALMAELGDPLPETPGPGDIEAEAGAVFGALAGRPIDMLLDLLDVTDPKIAAAQEVLSATLFPSYSANPLMFAVVAARLTARTIREGLTPGSVEGLNGFGIMACGPMNQVDLGYGISQVARKIADDKGLTGARARAETIHNAFIRHRKEPVRATLDGLIGARDLSLSCGDLHSAALSSYDHAFQVFWIGERMETAEEVMAEAAVFGDDLKIGVFPELIRIYRETLTALRQGPATTDRLSGSFMDGAELLEVYRARRDANGLAQLHIAQMLQAHIFGSPATALAEGRQAIQVLDGITSTPAVPACHAIFAMIATPAEEGARPDPQDAPILQMGRDLTALWAEHQPENYKHFALVTQAEAALAEGDETAWLEAMEAAADHATQQAFTRDAAMILERVATVSHVRGRMRRFSHFLRDAWRAWVHYGADAKVAALSDLHGAVLETFVMSEEEIDNSLSLSVQDEQLDLGALLKATRAISQEVHLAELLSALLSGIVETAGADNALVLAPDQNQFRIVAELAAGQDGPRYASAPDIASGRVCDAATAPLSALRLVSRLKSPLSTSDVAGDLRLSGDPFLQQNAPKSLAIVPMLNGGRLLGLVYLENRQITDAFSQMRLNLLSALCAQAAVSWDNANLYDRQSRLLEAADRFIPAELSRLFNRDSIADVRLTDARAGRMTLMVSDLRNSTGQAERLGPSQTFSQINAFLSGLSRIVRAHGGFVLKYVGDGVLAVFPDGPARAMDAAAAYQTELQARDWDPSATDPLNVGIAIHSGDVMFGVVGDETRMQIDALSDAVNVAFRLESMTKRMGVKVLVSEAALEDVGEADVGRHRCRILGDVETQGRSGLVGVHELLDAEPEEIRQAKLSTLEAFEEGVRRYGQQDYVNACVHLGNVLRESPADAAATRLFQDAARRMG